MAFGSVAGAHKQLDHDREEHPATSNISVSKFRRQDASMTTQPPLRRERRDGGIAGERFVDATRRRATASTFVPYTQRFVDAPIDAVTASTKCSC